MYSANEVADNLSKYKEQQIPLDVIAWKVAYDCIGWAYVYGARGEYCDPTNRRSRANPEHPTIKSACKNFSGKDSIPAGCVGCKWFLGTADSDESIHEGRTRFFDCRGFTYWVLLKVYGWKLIGSGATTQWNTASNWSRKGKIADMPEDTLCVLFVANGKTMEHTGFGINGETLECGAGGVKHSKTRAKKWTHWAVPACVESGVVPDQSVKHTLCKGDRGEEVEEAQRKLIEKGYSCGKSGADGIFGANTEKAVIAFQKAHGLTADGKVDQDTWDMLNSTTPVRLYTVTIPSLTQDEADKLLADYPGSVKVEEG